MGHEAGTGACLFMACPCKGFTASRPGDQLALGQNEPEPPAPKPANPHSSPYGEFPAGY